MSCEKHKLRKRKDCPDCFPERTDILPGDDVIEAAAEVLISNGFVPENIEATKIVIPKSDKDIPQTASVGDHIWGAGSEPEKALRFNEKDYIQALIDSAVKDAAARMRTELLDLKTIQWEHLDIPLAQFSMALMHLLGAEGWCYKDTYRGEVARISGCLGDTVIMTRVKSPKWPAAPDFSKRSTLKKYLERNNESSKI